METKARYALIGLFTLAVIVGGFAFVYWLNSAGGLRQSSPYRIRFETPVAGLLKGSAVLFNGIRVGEVTCLDLSPENPSRGAGRHRRRQRGLRQRCHGARGLDRQGSAGHSRSKAALRGDRSCVL
jgi:hypothetical protein